MVPAYNEELMLPMFYEELNKVLCRLANYTFTILFINDGSKDNTLGIIKDLKLKDSRIAYISLSRNFGKEIAMAAGFDTLKSDAVIIMDADLQHPPELIEQMVLKWEQGFDDVFAVQKERNHEGFVKKTFTKLFYSFLEKYSKVEIHKNAGDFRLLSKKVYEAIKKIRETDRYTKGLYAHVGFKKFPIEFIANPRKKGQSKWKFGNLYNLAKNGITSFTTMPLRISSILGVIISLIAFIYLIYNILVTFIYGDPVPGYPTLISVILFIGGFQLIGLGIIGEYLGRVFNETKNRPLYFIDEYEDENI